MRSIAAVIAGLILAGTTYGQAYNYTLHVDEPFDQTLISDCGEGNLGLHISGFIHGVIHLTRQNDGDGGSVSLEIHSGPRGDVQAVGLLTGTVYNVVGQTFTRVQFDKLISSYSYHNTFNIVGLADIKYVYHVLMGDGQQDVRSYVDSFRIDCSRLARR